MFIAGMLDAFPCHEQLVHRSIAATQLGASVTCALLPHQDHVLAGRRFDVAREVGAGTSFLGAAAHAHATWKSIRSRLMTSRLPAGIRAHAIAIFELLASAEARVHGREPDHVEFHEVGAWDSIADIVGAAALIDALDGTRWSTSPAPLGSGRVMTAHGLLPVPAPATTQLLMGMQTLDDGIPGERVTPTGAAILRHLCPPHGPPRRDPPTVRTLVRSGTGFGTRCLPGISNHLRVLCFEPTDRPSGGRSLHVLEFEVDDQSGEDLATGLERLRGHAAVLDVTQTAVFGKKGRMMVHVRVLVRHTALDAVVDACFRETTTIGLRHHVVHGIGLERRCETVDVDGQTLRVKVVQRPGGSTAKTEADDVSGHADHAHRAALRARAERAALRPAAASLDA